MKPPRSHRTRFLVARLHGPATGTGNRRRAIRTRGLAFRRAPNARPRRTGHEPVIGRRDGCGTG
jgi:hypothetical protein